MKPFTSFLLAALSVALPASASAQYCELHYQDYNSARLLTGTGMDLECSIGRAPFGNWGVDSLHSTRWDGDQFEGWNPWQHQGQYQWNSCNKPPYQRPNSAYYNYPQYEWISQATVTGERLFGNYWTDLVEVPCSAFEPVLTISGMFMRLYELDDWFGGDDFAGTLSYPTLNIPISCGGGYCSGDSGPVGPSAWSRSSKGPGGATADLRVFVEMFEY